MLTLLDCQQSTIPNVAGKCATSAEFTALINDATRKLMRRGDWVGTVVPIHICVQKGCLVMPRYVQSVRKLNTCHARLQPGNLWYNFIDNRDWNGGRWGGFGSAGFWGGRAYDGQGALAAQGQACCYNDVPGDGWFVRAYARCPQDYGKTITLFGVDNGNQPLRTNNGDGTWSDGITITLGSSGLNPNYGSTSVFVRRIDRVRKDVTQCQVMLYAYDSTTANTLFDLAIYDPGETTPTYSRYQLTLPHPVMGLSGACCSGLHSVVALCKLRFIPAQFPSDLVIVDNIDMLKFAVQSIRAQEAGDLQLASGYMASAVAEGNRDLEDQYPDDQFSAVDNVFGGHTFSNKCF